MKRNKTVLITGASSGIGKELAKIYAKNGYDLVLVARRKEKMQKIKDEFKNVNIEIVGLDLLKEESPELLYKFVKQNKIDVDILINNVGLGVYGEFTETDLHKELEMLYLNVNVLFELTKLFLQDMKRKKMGKILNVSSIAGFQPGPLMSGYYASKAFVLSFSQAIRNENKNSGVVISVLCPGPTDTEFEKSKSLKDASLLTKMGVMSAEKVAEITYKKLNKNRAIIVPGVFNKIAVFSNRILPRSLVLEMTRKIQETK